MVTCELSRAVCCLRRREHNPKHMQFTREREKLFQEPKNGPVRLSQKVWKKSASVDFCRGREGNIINLNAGIYSMV